MIASILFSKGILPQGSAVIVREIMKGKGFLLQKTTEKDTWEKATDPAIIKWWNGYSALLDFTNPIAINWFNAQLNRLVVEFGVDGFKFDAGDMNFYQPDALSRGAATPNKHCELYAKIGLRFPLNEYRACWKMAGQPLAQRLHDKSHNWQDVSKLIPDMLTEGLVGYTFSCPDMIGGGEYTSFLDLKSIDQLQVVRSAQIHALMPMMQFSVAPWRILDEAHFDAVKKAVAMRMEYTPLIVGRAKASAINGEPIIASLEYYYPNQGFESITDQFLLGPDLLVAPITTPDNSRAVALPNGSWKDGKGKIVKGGKTIQIEVALDEIPVFKKIK